MSHSTLQAVRRSGLHRAAGWGVVAGVATAATPLAFWWLPAATAYAMTLALIASVYIGFAVADGRTRVVAVEATVTGAFVLLAAVAATGTPWLFVAGFFLHGLKDLWQHRTGFVRQTRWWPPFCAVADWVAALAMTVVIVAGAPIH
jgi:hypothetical protein